MVETVVPSRPVTASVISHLGSLGFGVGDGQAPDPSTFPYSVVYSLDAVSRSGPMNDGQADVVHTQQVTVVGETQEQAQKLLDKVRVKMRDGTFSMGGFGREVSLIEVDEGDGVERDGREQPPLFYAIDVYMITTTPA